MDPMSTQEAARERSRNENGDIEFSMVFTMSRALVGVRSGLGMTPKTILEVTSVFGSHRQPKNAPEGLRTGSPNGPKSFDKTLMWAPDHSGARNGRHRLHLGNCLLRSTSGGDWAGFKVAQ